jgi:hypothetical protein
MSDDTSYREDIKVDKYDLADLWETHPDRFMKWADHYAQAMDELGYYKEQAEFAKDNAKADLEQLKAELYLDISEKLTQEGGKAPTKDMIESVILCDPFYQKKRKRVKEISIDHAAKVRKAESNVARLKLVKEAFEHRKTALDNLARLMIGGYYSTVLPKELRKPVEDAQEQGRESKREEYLNETMRRKQVG